MSTNDTPKNTDMPPEIRRIIEEATDAGVHVVHMKEAAVPSDLFGAAEPDNVVAEHRGVKIAFTPADCRFKALRSELFDGGRYHSLAAIKKAIDGRVGTAATLRMRTVRLPALDVDGDEREITGTDPDGDRLLGLPGWSGIFYPRAAWIADAIARTRALREELNALKGRLARVELPRWLSCYRDERNLTADQLFDRLLEEFERKRRLAEAGPDAVDRLLGEENADADDTAED
jgi:hypothetical protein